MVCLWWAPAFFILNVMSKVRVSSFSVSLDGYAAGPRQSLENPLGERGPELFQWFFPTRTFKQMQGQEGGSTGPDNEWAHRGMENVGAWILGRNMFGPVRGPWSLPDDPWRGWWGDEPPYHVPVFVLTHHPRKPLEMKGGTTFRCIHAGRGCSGSSCSKTRKMGALGAPGLRQSETRGQECVKNWLWLFDFVFGAQVRLTFSTGFQEASHDCLLLDLRTGGDRT
jgi:dihydrofolate reductase